MGRGFAVTMHPHENAFDRLRALQIGTILAGSILDEMRPRFAKLATRHADGTAPRAVSAFQLFQTPATEAARLVDGLALAPGARILEPSAGLGRILDALVDMASECAGELFKQDRPGVRILQRDFLSVTPEELGAFDAVAMNPPFHLRADVRHILHARKFLKPGGVLAALCFDTPHRTAALRSLCESWEVLPAGSFAKEGTGVGVVRLTMRAG